MNAKGQGALEYLLLIGGAVLVAAIVIALVTGIPGTVPNPTAASQCAMKSTYNTCILWPGTTVANSIKVGGICYACTPLKLDGTGPASSTTFARCGSVVGTATGC